MPVAAATIAALLAASAAGPDRGAAAEPRAFVPGAAALDSRSLAAESADAERDPDDPAAAAERRTYVTGMVGSTLAGSAADPGGRAGGAWPASAGVSGQAAVGVEIPGRVGTWRVEFEGRRFAATNAAGGPPSGGTRAAESTADGNWATTASAWRELPIVGDLAGYAGGGAGFGGAGGRVGPAWQAGGGLAWAVTERVTFDVGYRVHGAAPGAAGATAGEVLFAVRVFEPLRGWRR